MATRGFGYKYSIKYIFKHILEINIVKIIIGQLEIIYKSIYPVTSGQSCKWELYFIGLLCHFIVHLISWTLPSWK